MNQERLSAIADARNLHLALTSFAMAHEGAYPNRETAQKFNQRAGDKIAKWETVEECFDQLLITGEIKDERIFWNKPNMATGVVSKLATDDDGFIEVGENVWGYVRGLRLESPRNTPLIFDSTRENGVFETVVWGGKSIVAKVDGSVAAMDIDYGAGVPYREDGSWKRGVITEKQPDGRVVDIFKSLPDGSVILVPGGKPTP